MTADIQIYNVLSDVREALDDLLTYDIDEGETHLYGLVTDAQASIKLALDKIEEDIP